MDHELLARIAQLPLPERLAILEVLDQSLRRDVSPAPPPAAPAHVTPEHAATLAAITAQAYALHLTVPVTSALHAVFGIAAGAVPMPTDAVRAIVTDVVREHDA